MKVSFVAVPMGALKVRELFRNKPWLLPRMVMRSSAVVVMEVVVVVVVVAE